MVSDDEQRIRTPALKTLTRKQPLGPLLECGQYIVIDDTVISKAPVRHLRMSVAYCTGFGGSHDFWRNCFLECCLFSEGLKRACLAEPHGLWTGKY